MREGELEVVLEVRIARGRLRCSALRWASRVGISTSASSTGRTRRGIMTVERREPNSIFDSKMHFAFQPLAIRAIPLSNSCNSMNGHASPSTTGRRGLNELDDNRIRRIRPVVAPEILMEDYPLSLAAAVTVLTGRQDAEAIIAGESDRILVVSQTSLRMRSHSAQRSTCGRSSVLARFTTSRQRSSTPNSSRNTLMAPQRIYSFS